MVSQFNISEPALEIGLDNDGSNVPMTSAPAVAEKVIIVDTLIDENDGDFSAGDLSLREAIALVPDSGIITFSPNLAQTDVGFGQGVLGLRTFGLTIDKSLSINGLGAEALTIRLVDPENEFGDNVLKILNETIDVSIHGLTITGGYVFAQDGGDLQSR